DRATARLTPAMIEPDQFDEKLAGGGSGPTICYASAVLVRPNSLQSNAPSEPRANADAVTTIITIAIIKGSSFGISVRKNGPIIRDTNQPKVESTRPASVPSNMPYTKPLRYAPQNPKATYRRKDSHIKFA